jgi:hypothetical protein
VRPAAIRAHATPWSNSDWRTIDPAAAGAGWVPAFAVDWALDVLGWNDPAPPRSSDAAWT